MQTPEENAPSPTAKPPTPAAAAASSPTSGKSVAGAKAPPGGTRAEAGSSAAANQGKPGQTPKTGKTPELPADPEADAVDLLKADHRRVEALCAEFESAPDRRKAAIIREACTELTLHTLLEEEIFYPACRAANGQETEDALDEAQVEHDCAKLLIIELLASSQEDPLQAARFKVLAEQIKHHVAEEEAPRTGVFAKAKSAGVDTAALGRRLLERKRRLLKEADRLRPSHLVSFHQLQGENRPTQEHGMPRNQGPERDERGRFISDDDDDRRGGSYPGLATTTAGTTMNEAVVAAAGSETPRATPWPRAAVARVAASGTTTMATVGAGTGIPAVTPRPLGAAGTNAGPCAAMTTATGTIGAAS